MGRADPKERLSLDVEARAAMSNRIVVITHAYDEFERRGYLLRSLIGHWRDAGHDVSLAQGLGTWPDGDIAILHVDLSLVPEAYREASKRYPTVVNGAAHDIRKSLVSRHLVRKGDAWEGPVIVKSDLNCGGMPELRATELAKRAGNPAEAPVGNVVCVTGSYPIYRSVGEVVDRIWNNPGLVVERFLPEREPNGFCTRAWVFFGDRERCTRYRGDHPYVKSANILARETVPVPEALRAERERLGFDYGKFDFVVHDGEAILFDANRTPGAPPPPIGPELLASNEDLARGIGVFLGNRA